MGAQPDVHPRLTEEYEVHDGSFEVMVGRDWRNLARGGKADD